MTAFLGSGTIIPFSGWGIPVWIVLVLFAIVCFYLSIRYQQQIENFIMKLSGKMSKEKQELKENNNYKQDSLPVNQTNIEIKEHQIEDDNDKEK